jgi:hypothetical protein
MSGIYWYVSRQKVEALKESYAKQRGSWLRELSLKLKVPFVEAGAKITPSEQQALFDDIEKIADNLFSGLEVPSLTRLQPDESVAFFSFSGHAHRAVDRGAYWIVMAEGKKALLLAGSVSNAIGAPSEDKKEISPSIDPIGAVRRAFGEETQSLAAITREIGTDCSYVWQVVARPVRNVWDSLPRVEGIAAFGGIFQGSRAQFNRAGFPKLSNIVIGSPVYVRQI